MNKEQRRLQKLHSTEHGKKKQSQFGSCCRLPTFVGWLSVWQSHMTGGSRKASLSLQPSCCLYKEERFNCWMMACMHVHMRWMGGRCLCCQFNVSDCWVHKLRQRGKLHCMSIFESHEGPLKWIAQANSAVRKCVRVNEGVKNSVARKDTTRAVHPKTAFLFRP